MEQAKSIEKSMDKYAKLFNKENIMNYDLNEESTCTINNVNQRIYKAKVENEEISMFCQAFQFKNKLAKC